MDLNDPLHYKAYGVKRDYTQKTSQNYPQNQAGVVDEWKALIENRHKKFENDQKVQMEIKKQEQTQYKTQLDQIKTMQDQQRFQERVSKMNESLDMNERQKVLEQYNILKKDQDYQLKNYLSSTYRADIEQGIQRKQNETLLQQMEDDERMKRLKVTNDEEMKRKLQEKQEYIETQNKFKEYRDKLRENDKIEEKKKHEDYSRQCEENNRLQDAKERMYKKFFSDFEQNLNSKAKNYLDTILEEEIKKDMAMRNWETNGNDPLFKKMSEERIRQEVENKLKDASEIKEFNKYAIEQHEKDRGRQVEISKMELEFRKVKQEEMRQEDERRKLDDREHQRLYGDTLGFQTNISQRMKKNYGSMTEQEKKMNKNDLKSYKVGENTIHSMIPGINNIQSVGSTPLIRKGANINMSPLQSTVADSSINDTRDSGRFTGSQTINRNASSGALLNQQYKYGLYDQNPIKDSIHSKKVNVMTDQDIQEMRKSFDQRKLTVGYYNPITNPVPNFNQNPYIARERSKATLMGSFSKPVLSQAGNNILM